MKHFGKKILSVVLALMCIATVGAISASAKTTSSDRAFSQALKSAYSNSATFDKKNWSGYFPSYHNGKVIGRNNQNYKTGMQIDQYKPSSGYRKRYSISVNDKSGKHSYVQQFGIKNGSNRPQKIGHAQKYNIVLG